ncbi:farnesol dehydrogenase-like [Tribolium madens]|uniref:farnesol dehydrogenase-like n=1 Tax=Tribolium madens TaxID=41895 RepID=UPI001CF7472C|nr:farnesol dehydrogenase-like [Tribolium madens]
MDRWEGKVAIVTGASIGVGPTIMKVLAEKGMKVVGLARLTHRIQDLGTTLTNPTGQILALKCDITKDDDVIRTFNYICDKLGPIQVLINNAALSRSTSLIDGEAKEWRRIFDVNVMALCICTREAVKIMRKCNVAGHVIHMNSIAGHIVPNMAEPTLNVYPASKFAVTALTETLRQELRFNRSLIKVTSISPGLVRDLEENDSKNFDIPTLKPEDIADAVIYVLSTGPHVQVHELTIHPLGELF